MHVLVIYVHTVTRGDPVAWEKGVNITRFDLELFEMWASEEEFKSSRYGKAVLAHRRKEASEQPSVRQAQPKGCVSEAAIVALKQHFGCKR